MHKIFSNLKTDSFSSFTFVSISSLVGLFIAYSSINALGAEIFGLWTLLIILLSFSMIIEQAIGLPIIRMANIDSRDKNFYVFISSFLPILFFLVLIFVACLFMNPLFLETSKKIMPNLKNQDLILPSISLILLFSFIDAILSSFLTGFKKLYVANYIKSFARLLQIFILVIFLYLDFAFWSLVFSTLIYFLVSFILFLFFTIREFRIPVSIFNKEVFSELWSIGLKLISARIVGLFGDPFIKFSLGAMVGLQSVAFFEICLKIAGTFSQIPILVFSGKIPTFKVFLENKTPKLEIKKYFKYLDFYLFLYVSFCFLLTYFVIETVLMLFFDMNYNSSTKMVFFFLILTLFFNVFFISRLYFLIANGDGSTNFFAYLSQSIVLIFCILAIHLFIENKTILILTTAYCISHIFSSLIIFFRFKKSFTNLTT